MTGKPLAAKVWSVTAGALQPVVRLLLRRRLARGKELPDRVCERRGLATLPRPPGRLLWLHAASVGETVSVLALLDGLCTLDPALHVLMTTGSVTSQRLLSQRLQSMGLDGRVSHQFAPLDVPRWLRRFLDHWQPQALALVESELWPNLIAAAVRRRVPMALVNARLSARSDRAWRRLPGLARWMLRRFRWITARSDEDAARLHALGGRDIDSPGDLKAAAPALAIDPHELQRLRQAVGERTILLAACTHDGEEAVIARAHAILSASVPGLLTIVAPRHPERGAAISDLLNAAPRRALNETPDPAHSFWICDTLGEMELLYRLCPIAFIGNSLEVLGPNGGGGHNPYEPARSGCAIAIGPLNFNFNDGVRTLREAGALEITPTADAIAAWAARLLGDPDARMAQAQAARRIAAGSPGLAAHLARRVLNLMFESPT